MTARGCSSSRVSLRLIVLAAVPAWRSARAADIPDDADAAHRDRDARRRRSTASPSTTADQQIVTVSDDKTARVWSATRRRSRRHRARRRSARPRGRALCRRAVALGQDHRGRRLYRHRLGQQRRDLSLQPRRRELARPHRARRRHRCHQPSRLLARRPLHRGRDQRPPRAAHRRHARAQRVKIVDRDYADAIEWLDFAPDGRLVTSSLDGTVRLYDASFKRIATLSRAGRAASRFAVAFSKRRLGGRGRAARRGRRSWCWAAATSSRAAELKGAPGRQRRAQRRRLVGRRQRRSMRGGTYGDAERPEAASATGRSTDLAKAHRHRRQRRYRDRARRARRRRRLRQRRARPGASSAADGKVAFRHDRVYADFRDGDRSFRAVARRLGGRVRLRAEAARARRASTCWPARSSSIRRPAADLKPPATSAGGTGAHRLAQWRQAQAQRPHRCRSTPTSARAAASVAGDRALLGTDYFLRAYQGRAAGVADRGAGAGLGGEHVGRRPARGRRARRRHHPLVSPGRRRRDPEPLRRARRQALGAWTPEGFFDHGEGGEQLIGYHLNQVDQGRPKGAAFVRVEQLYALFFRRDLVVKKFRGQSERRDRRQLARDRRRAQRARQGPAAGHRAHRILPRHRLLASRRPRSSSRGVGKLQLRDASGARGRAAFRRGRSRRRRRPDHRARQGRDRRRDRQDPRHQGQRPQRGAHRQARARPNIIMLSAFNGAKEIETEPKERPLLALRFEPRRRRRSR